MPYMFQNDQKNEFFGATGIASANCDEPFFLLNLYPHHSSRYVYTTDGIDSTMLSDSGSRACGRLVCKPCLI